MTRALVTGSTGCVGANLVAALNERGIEVVGLKRKTSPDDATHDLRMTPVVGDVLDPASLRAAVDGVDWVFHVAAVSDYWHTAPDVIYRVNVEGTRNMLEAALQAGVRRFVLTSSAAALGFPRSNGTPMHEGDRFNLKPSDFPYAHSKQLAEDLLADYVTRGLDAVSVLPSAVIGPRDIKFVGGELIVQAIRGFPALPRGGLNYVDARDVACGHIAAAERGRTGERYILAGHNMTHRETLEQVALVLGTRVPRLDIPNWLLPLLGGAVAVLKKLGFDLPIDRGRILASSRLMYYDNSKAVRELGLMIRPFTDSIRDAYQWYAEHGYLAKRGIKPSDRPVGRGRGSA